LNPSIDDPISCTNILPNPNSNGYPYVDLSLLIGTYSSNSSSSYGDVIYGTSVDYLVTYTTIGTTDGATLPLITFCALASVFFYSFLIHELEAPPSLAMFFFLRTFLGDYYATFFLFSSAIYISFLVLFTLADGFMWILLLVDKQILKDFC
jgi:hypothetical protein